jgi:hypothetical protein
MSVSSLPLARVAQKGELEEVSQASIIGALFSLTTRKEIEDGADA